MNIRGKRKLTKALATAFILATTSAHATEWWINKDMSNSRSDCIRATEGKGVPLDWVGGYERFTPFKAPADLFEEGQRRGTPTKIIDNGDEVIVSILTSWAATLYARRIAEDGPEIWTPKYHFFRTKEACEAKLKAERDEWKAYDRRAKEANEAERRRLDKYR
jgi:hypothetical protein